MLDRVLRHNLRNRMNVVMGHTEVALVETESETVRESLESVLRAAADLLSISDSAREFRSTLAPDDHGSVELRNVAAQVETVVSEYLSEHREPRFSKKSRRVRGPGATNCSRSRSRN
ncbi:hypothetical protein [Halolamina sp.]|uniref:hypothetical protein n=1 Tax=Halolamina sp. TaxID=1940283 RepID=UPI00356657D5